MGGGWSRTQRVHHVGDARLLPRSAAHMRRHFAMHTSTYETRQTAVSFSNVASSFFQNAPKLSTLAPGNIYKTTHASQISARKPGERAQEWDHTDASTAADRVEPSPPHFLNSTPRPLRRPPRRKPRASPTFNRRLPSTVVNSTAPRSAASADPSPRTESSVSNRRSPPALPRRPPPPPAPRAPARRRASRNPSGRR